MADQSAFVVVIGGSAGGIPSLLQIIGGLPATFRSSVLVVVHIGQSRSMLPRVISRAGSLPCVHAIDSEAIRPGKIYVAPPDYHLLVQGNHLKLSHGPREHHTRPAIDPLFISASRAFGPQVIGIILSGALNDGAAGLLAIKSRGGRVIVQDPEDALIEGMPRSALRLVQPDAILPADQIAEAVLRMVVSKPVYALRGNAMAFDQERSTTERIQQDFREQVSDQRTGELTPFTCPDCGGTLWQAAPGDLLSFRCHVGHTWSWEALVGQKSDQLEAALWASVRLLVERATLNRQIASRSRQERIEDRSERFMEQAERDEEYAALIRRLLETFENYGGDTAEESVASAE